MHQASDTLAPYLPGSAGAPPGRDPLSPFVPRSEARGEGAPAQRGRGRPAGPGKPVSHQLPPTSPAPLALRRAGTFPHFVGDKAFHRLFKNVRATAEKVLKASDAEEYRC